MVVVRDAEQADVMALSALVQALHEVRGRPRLGFWVVQGTEARG